MPDPRPIAPAGTGDHRPDLCRSCGGRQRGFCLLPQLDWFWSLLVGGVRAVRDLAQRHWGHRVLLLLLLMLLGACLSWRLGAAAIAVASAPIDTAVFQHLADLWSWPEL